MALRVLSGMLFISGGPKAGLAVIGHSPFRLIAAPTTVSLRKARVVGADGGFLRRPASIIAARQFAIQSESPATDYKLRISDTVTRTATTIRWAGTGPIFSEEIPFLVVGEAADLQPALRRRRTRRAKRAARRRAAPRRRSR